MSIFHSLLNLCCLLLVNHIILLLFLCVSILHIAKFLVVVVLLLSTQLLNILEHLFYLNLGTLHTRATHNLHTRDILYFSVRLLSFYLFSNFEITLFCCGFFFVLESVE